MEITTEAVKEALAQILSPGQDVYDWALNYAYLADADEDRTWFVLIDLLCDKLGLENDEDEEVCDGLCKLTCPERWNEACGEGRDLVRHEEAEEHRLSCPDDSRWW